MGFISNLRAEVRLRKSVENAEKNISDTKSSKMTKVEEPKKEPKKEEVKVKKTTKKVNKKVKK